VRAQALIYGTPSGSIIGPSINYGWPYSFLSQGYSRLAGEALRQTGTTRWPNSGLRIFPDNRGWLRIDLPVAKDAVTRTAWLINLPTALSTAAVVYAAYWATWSVCYGLSAFNAWRWRRANRCEHCGYPLAPA
jgi:hypothetical protein